MIGVFELSLRLQRKVLKRHFGVEKLDLWLGEAKRLHRQLVRELPDIGGRTNEMLPFLKTSLCLMPIVLVLKREGIPAQTIGAVIYDLAATTYLTIPAFARKALAIRFFSRRRARRWVQIAARSQRRAFAGDWVVSVVEAPPSFDYGYDITECAILKFWRQRGLGEFVPYLCLTDWAKWSAFGIHAHRTQTLANGHDHCDFRFTRDGGAIASGWPPESMPEWTGGRSG